MSPAGKIINIDAFKNKASGLRPSQSGNGTAGAGTPGGLKFTILLACAVIAALSYIMIPAGKGIIPILPVGSIAPKNIKAPEEMLVEDKESTEKNRRKAMEAVLDIYDYDSEAEKEISEKISQAFTTMANGYKTIVGSSYTLVIEEFEKAETQDAETENPDKTAQDAELQKKLAESKQAVADFEKSEAFETLESGFKTALGVELDEKSIQTLRYYHYWSKLGERISSIVSPLFSKGIVIRKSQLPASSSQGITIRVLSTGAERIVKNFENIYDAPEARKIVKDRSVEIVPGDRPAQRRLIGIVAGAMIQPNLTFNHKETDIRMAGAAKAVNPVFFQIQRGEMIIREGARVTPAHMEKLKSLAGNVEDEGRFAAVAGTLIFNILLITLSILFLNKYHEEARDSPKLQILIALLLVTHMALILIAVNVFTVFIQQTPQITLQTYLIAAPLAFGPMIVSIFFTTQLTVLFTIVVSVLTGLMLRDYPILALLTITGGMVCAYQVRHYYKRSAVLKVGLLIAFVNALVVIAYVLIGSKHAFDSQLYEAGFALAGGALTVTLVSGALPLIESLFPVVSDIKLLELTNLNHKLLEKMIMKAPGTYHHSMMVGNLAEEACKSIGANALLAKAGALFHDIGKMKKSEYFVENHRNQQNPHDKLTPYMSALILTNHIKDGMELAKKHKLLPQIIKMIPEHHGTQLIKVFYRKAKDAEDINRAEVSKDDFRYPGPIPSSRESACVALADSIEAAARACKDPSHQRIKELVTEVINDKFMQGQLDNSHLTLRDLALIADSFIHVVSSMHHHRVEYPVDEKEQDVANAGEDPHANRDRLEAENGRT